MRAVLRRLVLVAVGIVLGWIGRGWLRPAAAQSYEFSVPIIDPVSESNVRWRNVLLRPLPAMSFNGAKLGEVIDSLRELTELSIYLDWRELEKVGINQHLPITLQLPAGSTGEGLERICRTVGSDRARLVAVVNHGVVSITTSAAANDRSVLRIYDLPKSITTPSTRDSVPRLITLLKGLEPLSWSEFGGHGSAREFSGKLLVTQTPRVHEQVATFLQSYTLRPKTDGGSR